VRSILLGLSLAQTRGGLRPTFITRGMGFGHFSFEIKTSVSLVKPLLYCLHHSGLQRAGGARHGSDGRDGMRARHRSRARDGTWARPVGTVRMTNPHGLGWARQHGPQRIQPKPRKRENKIVQKRLGQSDK
jgi:hypothetical protein